MSEMQLYGTGPADLTLFSQELDAVARSAEILARTSFVPKPFQGKPAEIAAAMMAGREWGVPPMTALSVIHVIEGRPTMSANALRGLAMAKGVVFELISASDTLVRMRARPPGQETWTEAEWPIERARLMGLTNKSNWQKMPQAMLIARATSELCRLVAANILMGLPYSTEEMRDTIDGEATELPDRAPARARKVRRNAPIQATVVHEEPPLEDPEPEIPDGEIIGQREIEAAPEPDDGEKITDTTRKAIMAGFNELNITDRAVRLEKVSTVLGRDIPSVNVLTEAEGRQVVAKLQEVRQNWPAVAEPPQ